VKRLSEIVTLVAVGAITVAAGALPATAQDRRPADATRPNYQYTPRGTERPPQSGAHADYHMDSRVGGTEGTDRKEGDRSDRDRGDRSDPRLRDERDERRDSRWTPGAERYTRPPQQWSR
jgi:hypothetical protein